MKYKNVSRRGAVGCFAMVSAAAASSAAFAGQASDISASNEETIRKYYSAWEVKNWAPFEKILASDFTFTSANGDDHISKSAFKTRCWETQVNYIKHFDLLQIIGRDDKAFVMYICQTKNGKTFRNVEFFRFSGGKIAAIESYFGASASFASAASKRQA